MLTHRALLANIEQVAAVEPPMIHGDDVVLGVLPLFHVYGLNAVLGVVLRHRAKLVLAAALRPAGDPRPDRRRGLQRRPGRAAGVRLLARRRSTLRERLGPVRLMLSGLGAAVARARSRSSPSATGIPIHQGYGLTEASPVVTCTLCSEELQNGSVGAALPGIEIRLVDELGQPPEGEDPGEISIRGANLFSGYWPDGCDGPDEDGWWSTGDVGFLDPSGDLFLVDRLKELVIVSGFNVYPIEVEDVIREVDGVTEAAVIGVADDADRRGRRGVRRGTGSDDAARRATPYASTARRGWPGSSSPAGSRSSGSCRSASPARCRRAGCGAWSGDGRWACWSEPRRVTLYGKPGCHLCDDARAVVEPVCAELGESYDEISILDDPALQHRFGEEIPVTFVDGRQHDFWRVDPDRLRRALSPPPGRR